MNHEICIVLVLLQIQVHLYKSENIYCQEAVASVALVTSCPTSKIEWDTAARKKNCSRIASQQKCAPVEKFQYHCVINGYSNETLEVCAPLRIIIGHCVEFNQLGGVIQDQLLSPCNDTFPKCDGVYYSTAAYKYPDCYKLVSMNWKYQVTEKMPISKIKDVITSTKTTTTTTTTTNALVSIVSLTIGFIAFLLVITGVITFGKGRRSILESTENNPLMP